LACPSAPRQQQFGLAFAAEDPPAAEDSCFPLPSRLARGPVQGPPKINGGSIQSGAKPSPCELVVCSAGVSPTSCFLASVLHPAGLRLHRAASCLSPVSLASMTLASCASLEQWIVSSSSSLLPSEPDLKEHFFHSFGF